MLPNNFSTSTCFIIFELIKFMCFGSTLIYPHKEFLIPRPSRNSTKYNPLPPRSKFNCTAVYAENCQGDCFIQWQMVVICFWCADFVTSQFDVIFMFTNQRFGEVC